MSKKRNDVNVLMIVRSSIWLILYLLVVTMGNFPATGGILIIIGFAIDFTLMSKQNRGDYIVVSGNAEDIINELVITKDPNELVDALMVHVERED